MFNRIFFRFRRCDRDTIPGVCLAACWIAGSSLGLCAARFFGDAYALFLPSLAGIVPSFEGILASALFPLFFSACAVVLFQGVGCYAACLFRGVSLGFALGAVGLCFGGAAPLMAFLLLFTMLLSNAVLLIFWLRRLELGFVRFWEDVLVCGALCAMIGLTDRLIIAPFLADLINF